MVLFSRIEFTEVNLDEKQTLAQWLSSDVWNNFTNPEISIEGAVRWIELGGLHGDNKKTFWIEIDSQKKVGLIQLYDFLDSTSMFDIRINTSHRGMRIGRKAVSWLTNFAFENYSGISRIEANTRQDNVAMRKVLKSCGYVKEAHYRAGWETGDSPSDWVDAVAYAILRYDWANHTTTPVHWDDETSLPYP
ncbi:GNAT family N-acetyltransferase [Alicyclobacillus dauci]|uniref:GNAT family N-acetyltransferase n=1 Tax=Alicyclobacillus dauci TaxID=1475485 RepID=A0ABY6YZE0_9BACL|nr:GNAT family N-acetyltransferase [Alicyclobacillus dauci]WAH35989.1 GNAT family N-acetyltransferase [Alicyclobacillus dauci]